MIRSEILAVLDWVDGADIPHGVSCVIETDEGIFVVGDWNMSWGVCCCCDYPPKIIKRYAVLEVVGGSFGQS